MKTILIVVWSFTLVVLILFAAMCFVLFVPRELLWRDPAMYAAGGFIGIFMTWRLMKIIYRDTP